jgi:hypothetical protein
VTDQLPVPPPGAPDVGYYHIVRLCPLNAFLPCARERCAWWVENARGCAAHVLAAAVNEGGY